MAELARAIGSPTRQSRRMTQVAKTPGDDGDLVVSGVSRRKRPLLQPTLQPSDDGDWVVSGVSSRKHPSLQPSDDGDLVVSAPGNQETTTATAVPTGMVVSGVSHRKQPPLVPDEDGDMVVRLVSFYGEQPATPLAQLARELGVSSTTASRLRIQAMRQGLLVRVARGHYSPNGHQQKAA